MKLPQLSLRELFLLVALVAMGCGWWAEHSRARRLKMEVTYLTSSIPPLDFIETPLEDVVLVLSRKHNIRIDVDWENLESLGITPKTLITQRLIDGSLTLAMTHAFHSHEDVRVVPDGDGIRVTTKDVAGSDVPQLRNVNPPDTQRLFRLIEAIDAEGYRVTFERAARPGEEEVTLERLANPKAQRPDGP